MSALEQEEKKLKALARKIDAKITTSPPTSLIDEEMIGTYKDTEKELVTLVEELNLGVAEICDDHEALLGQSKVTAWNEKAVGATTKLIRYRQEMAQEIRKLKQNASLSSQASNAAQPSLNSTIEQERLTFERDKLRRQEDRIQVEAEARCVAITDDVTRFANKFPANASDWAMEENIEIEIAMKQVHNWEKEMIRIKKESRDVEILVKGNSLADPDNHMEQMLLKVSSTQELMDKTIKWVKELDKARNLNSLGGRKTDAVKLPQFSGRAEEDYVTFKKKMEKGFLTNRIPTDDQVEKLRENLREPAKLIVAEDTDSIETAWELLQSAYGSEDKVMQSRKEKLSSMGQLPEAGAVGKAGHSKRVIWCLTVERILAEMIELGNRSDTLAKEAFSNSTIKVVIGLFPSEIRRKMIRVAGDGFDKMSGIVDVIVTERNISQEDEQYVVEEKKSIPSKRQDGRNPTTNLAQAASSGTTPNLGNPKGYQTYRGPTKSPNCRICKTLEARGDTTGLYENHLGNYATGCPRYAALTTEERFEITKQAKICLRCLDPKSTWVFRDGHKNCLVSKTKKNRFSCSNPNCSWHSWICCTHKTENDDLLKKFVDEMSKKGVTFVFHNAQLSQGDEADLLPQHETPVLGADSLHVRDTSKDLTREEAVDKLRKLTPQNVKLDTEQKGFPMFMFGSAEGKTRSVNILYDSGCSDCLMDKEVPETGECEGVKVAHGPFSIGAIAGVQVMAKDAWMLKLKMADGSVQLLEGLSVDRVTSDFPRINLTVATKAVKADQPKNKLLQSVIVPDWAGGHVDFLLGIKYNAFFPILIHMLPCGLAIYKLRIKPFQNNYTAVIAGPHASFNRMLDKAGNAAYLFQEFTRGLQSWRTLGAPRIKELLTPAMTFEEMAAAKHFNKNEHWNYGCEVDEIPGEKLEAEDKQEDLFKICLAHGDSQSVDGQVSVKPLEAEEITRSERLVSITRADLLESPKVTVNKSVQQSSQVVEDDQTACKFIICSRCGIELLQERSDTEKTLSETDALVNAQLSADKRETANKMKKIVEVQDAGLQIEYRCPKCRQCSDCLKPIETERVSLREEAEMIAISDSVHLDLKNKRIICSLPLRGTEEEFLSSNRYQAEKILNQQCLKYFNEEATKPVILKAFQKLFDNKHAKLMRDLPPDIVEKILSKAVQHHIPWRVVFKDSVSTPARPVLDASSNTPQRPDGTGGRSLNDACMKGRIPDMNLLRMVLRFIVGRFALAGDLSQFYNVFKLIIEQWNLQLFLWKEDMDPANETLVGVISTLIYGVKSVAAQSEAGVTKLAMYIQKKHPDLSEFLLKSRYVDDLADSKPTLQQCKELTEKADLLFSQVGMSCKDWSYTGSSPSDKVSSDGTTVSFGGMSWSPELDYLEPKIPTWHFGTVCRGRIRIGTEVFEGALESDMEKFVPQKITPRQISSKFLSYYDILQLAMPVTAGMKRDLRRVMKETDGWDTKVTDELRSIWVKNLWKLEKLKGLKFVRAKMPEDAVGEKMRMLVLVDAAKMLIVSGVWVGFKLKNGDWSCAYLIGRCLLTAEDSTTPKDELNGLTCGGNMCFLVREALGDWVESYSIFCDSTIALHWVKSNKLRLSLFHRNRVGQIRRTTELNNIFHVVTDQNLADLPTRPDKVNISDAGPLSPWHTGLDWMRKDISKCVEDKILTPLEKLSMPEDMKEEFEQGFVFEKTKDILTRGHIVTKEFCGLTLNKERIDLVYSRAAYANYLLHPTKFHFPAVVRILGIVCKFIKSFKCRKGKPRVIPKFTMLQATAVECHYISLSSVFQSENSNEESHRTASADNTTYVKKVVIMPGDEDISDALAYLFRTATMEVKEFVKPDILKKISVESEGILYSKSRVMDGQRFILSGDLKDSGILADKGIIIHTPLVERFSPLAYSIAEYVHDKLAKHSGYETCHRTSLGFCLIMKGAGLYEEFGEACVICKKLRKKFLEVSMGPISSHQFAVCPPFWVTQADLFGPVTHYVPGRERNTRNNPALHCNCHVFVMVCVVTKLTNIQVVESKDVGGICCALTRLGCEVGMPKLFLIDQDSGIMAALRDAEVHMLDASLKVYKEHGVRFETCPVAGHNAHGLVERKIKTAQELMEKSGVTNLRMHTTGLQTTVKLVENMMNNTPYGYSYGRSKTNTKLMKLVSPNMMKIGRIHSRTLNGPIKLPEGPATMMDKVEEAYQLFYKLYNDTMVAKLIQETNPKWFRSDKDIKVDDVVYFRKEEGSAIKGAWTVGCVEEVHGGKDGLIREAKIRYCNPSENVSRYTTRSVRTIVRLFNVLDSNWRDDMEEVRKMLKAKNIEVVIETEESSEPGTVEVNVDANLCNCCCKSHCALSLHVSRGIALVKQEKFVKPEVDIEMNILQEGWDYKVDKLADFCQNETTLANPGEDFEQDSFMGLVTSLNMDFTT